MNLIAFKINFLWIEGYDLRYMDIQFQKILDSGHLNSWLFSFKVKYRLIYWLETKVVQIKMSIMNFYFYPCPAPPTNRSHPLTTPHIVPVFTKWRIRNFVVFQNRRLKIWKKLGLQPSTLLSLMFLFFFEYRFLRYSVCITHSAKH